MGTVGRAKPKGARYLIDSDALNKPKGLAVGRLSVPLPSGYSDSKLGKWIVPVDTDWNAPLSSGSGTLCIGVTATPSPMEQFALRPAIPIRCGSWVISFTNASMFYLLALAGGVLLVSLVSKRGGSLVPNAAQLFSELGYEFVLKLGRENIVGRSDKLNHRFFPLLLVTFSFLFICNVLGLVPYGFPVFSQCLGTCALSLSILIGISIVGVELNGLHFLSVLLPEGVPMPLAPLLVLIELLSYWFRALSLGIRLFANLMAGHSVVNILSGFAWSLLLFQDRFYFMVDLGLFGLVCAFTLLELLVAILQAYVFTLLISSYLNDALMNQH